MNVTHPNLLLIAAALDGTGSQFRVEARIARLINDYVIDQDLDDEHQLAVDIAAAVDCNVDELPAVIAAAITAITA